MRNKRMLINFVAIFVLTQLCFVPNAFSGLPNCLEVQAGVGVNEVWFKVYDNTRQEWVEDTVWFGSGVPYNLIIQDGVVAWIVRNDFHAWYYVYFTVYDPSEKAWKYDNEWFTNEVVLNDSLKNEDRIVTWVVRDDLFDPPWHDVYFTVYDPSEKRWISDYDCTFDDIPSNLSINNATVSYTSGYWTEDRGYQSPFWGSGKTEPFAYFYAGPKTEGDYPLTVWFIDMSIGGTSWNWDFADGQTSSERCPSNTFFNGGSFTVTQTVKGTEGSTDTDTTQITVFEKPDFADLVVLKIETDPDEPEVGQMVNVYVTIKNQGTGRADKFRTDWYADLAATPLPHQHGDRYWEDDPETGLAVGETYTMNTTYMYSVWGGYSMYAQVNTDEAVLESDRTNNVFGPVSITVAKKGGPCLVNTTNDVDDGACDSLHCSLREAINQCNFIRFDASLATQTITLSGRPLPIITGTVSIDGSTAPGLTVSGANISRVFHTRGDVSLVALTIADGSTDGDGGGILNDHGILKLINTTVTNNSAANGGGIFNAGGWVTIINSTVSTNTAVRNADNTYGGVGGGIFNMRVLSPGWMELINSTVTNNSAANSGGGGIKMFGEGLVELTNTIVAGNIGGGNCVGWLTSLGHNLDSDGTCDLTDSTDLPNTDPLLGPLSDNGGPTLTHALLPGSPGIDAGDNTACPETDQRGIVRPQNEQCDIGAFEQINLDGDNDGVVNFDDLRIVTGCFAKDPNEECTKADVNDDGKVNILDVSLVVSDFSSP